MLVVKIYLAAMSRADEPAIRLKNLPRFYFYVDEFQSMMNEAFADILSESRKYKLALTLANQYIEQMEEEVRDAVFGNIGTLICFRVGPFDAEVLTTIFEPTFTPEDLVGLGIGQIYLTLMIDGVGSRPFSAETIPPIESPSITYRDDVIRSSREQYARPRAEMEAFVMKRQKDFAPPPKSNDRNSREGSSNRFPRRDGPPNRDNEHRRDARPRSDFAPRSEQRFDTRPERRIEPPAHPHREAPAPLGIQRDALRAAIAEAVPQTSSRSPAEILREKLARKPRPDYTQGPAPENKLTPEARPHVPVPPLFSKQQAHSNTTREEKGNGEVSPDILRRVLRGDDDEH
jgi:hypothetical protein